MTTQRCRACGAIDGRHWLWCRANMTEKPVTVQRLKPCWNGGTQVTCEHDGVLLDFRRGNQYTCKCGWKSARYPDSSTREDAWDATQRHVTEGKTE